MASLLPHLHADMCTWHQLSGKSHAGPIRQTHFCRYAGSGAFVWGITQCRLAGHGVVTCVQHLVEVPGEDEEQRPLHGHDSHRNRHAIEAIVQVVEAEALASLPVNTPLLSGCHDISSGTLDASCHACRRGLKPNNAMRPELRCCNCRAHPVAV